LKNLNNKDEEEDDLVIQEGKDEKTSILLKPNKKRSRER